MSIDLKIHPPNILTIAGSDSGGGAGIQADLKTIMSLGGYGVCAVTALTAQNGSTVAGVEAVSPDFVALQLKTVLAGFNIAAAKTGMLFSKGIIKSVVTILKNHDFPLVIDPVSVSQSGCKLLADDALEALKTELLPLADLVTPNIPEAEALTGIKIKKSENAYAAGDKLLSYGAKAVLIKGGHLDTGIINRDWLIRPDAPPKSFEQPHIDTTNNHGTGCTLSAAIATRIGKGMPLEIAISQAQKYLNTALRKSYSPGIGHGSVNHAANLCVQ